MKKILSIIVWKLYERYVAWTDDCLVSEKNYQFVERDKHGWWFKRKFIDIDNYKHSEPIAEVISKEATKDGIAVNFKLTEYGKSPEVLEFLRKIGIEV